MAIKVADIQVSNGSEDRIPELGKLAEEKGFTYGTGSAPNGATTVEVYYDPTEDLRDLYQYAIDFM